MKSLTQIYPVLRMADGPGGEGGDKEKDKAAKPAAGTVKVKATLNPVRVGEVVVEPDLLDKRGKLLKAATPVEISEKEFKRHGSLLTKVASLIVLALLCTFHAAAQQYKGTSIAVTNGSSASFDGVTNLCVMAATSTNTINAVIPLTKTGDVGLMHKVSLGGSGTSGVTYTYDQSYDATNWNTSVFTVVITAAGTTAVSTNTERTLGNVGYLRLASIANVNGSAATNTLRYYTKPSRYSQ